MLKFDSDSRLIGAEVWSDDDSPEDAMLLIPPEWAELFKSHTRRKSLTDLVNFFNVWLLAVLRSLLIFMGLFR